MLYSHNPDITRDSLKADYKVPTKAELIASKTKKDGTVPKGVGNRWTPVDHADLIDQIIEAASEAQLTPLKQQFDLSKDTHSLYGSIEFEGLAGFDYTDRVPVLGFRHCNLQRFRLLGVTGARMFICANGQISGSIVFGAKHSTGNASSGMGIREGVQTWMRQAVEHQALMSAMDVAEISSVQVDNLLMTAAREDIVPASQLLKVDAAYKAYLDSENPHHVFAPRTAGSLYQAVTEVGKGWRPNRVERSMARFPQLVTRELGITAASNVDAALIA